MQDWAELHRLFHRERLPKAGVARRLGMSRNTVDRVLALKEPPVYARVSPSKLNPFKDQARAMLAADPPVPATAILERLRREGFDGSITILKRFVVEVRPQCAAAQAFQRTGYLPGEIGQVDWWHTGIKLDVGRGSLREALGLVVSLPHSAAHAVTFTLAKDLAAFLAGLLGALKKLGGLLEKLVFDNDTSIMASRQGGTARLHLEVAALLGQLAVKPVVLRPATPTSKGQVDRTIRFLATSAALPTLRLRQVRLPFSIRPQVDRKIDRKGWAGSVTTATSCGGRDACGRGSVRFPRTGGVRCSGERPTAYSACGGWVAAGPSPRQAEGTSSLCHLRADGSRLTVRDRVGTGCRHAVSP